MTFITHYVDSIHSFVQHLLSRTELYIYQYFASTTIFLTNHTFCNASWSLRLPSLLIMCLLIFASSANKLIFAGFPLTPMLSGSALSQSLLTRSLRMTRYLVCENPTPQCGWRVISSSYVGQPDPDEWRSSGHLLASNRLGNAATAYVIDWDRGQAALDAVWPGFQPIKWAGCRAAAVLKCPDNVLFTLVRRHLNL